MSLNRRMNKQTSTSKKWNIQLDSQMRYEKKRHEKIINIYCYIRENQVLKGYILYDLIIWYTRKGITIESISRWLVASDSGSWSN